ncbi:MAG: hypothetical protein NTY81_03820 [Candidatus Staskawiczbacteria bacterium]|nr:hypothetical protein [Candidatus Staskawiczbacteria bacterium]
MAWDYNKREYAKQMEKDPIWGLERLINFGLGKEKIDRELLEKYIHKLKIPENRRAFLELLLWDKKF